MAGALHLGLDIGTSGCRAIVIDDAEQPLLEHAVPLPAPARNGDHCEQDPELWWQAITALLAQVCPNIPRKRLRSIAVDGTSATLLLTDRTGTPLTPALMYNDGRGVAQAALIATLAPDDSAARGVSSALAKLLYLTEAPLPHAPAHALHQADWIAGQLSGRFGISDENNCLKLGYDAVTRQWPAWLQALLGSRRALLPEVVAPGAALGTLAPQRARQFDLPADVQVVAGTTDGVAAFIATGAHQPGDAVTSLGSTLVLKLLSETPVFAPEFGVYSHRLGDLWLVGGASNCGGATLLQFFTAEQMQSLTPRLTPNTPTGLNYYPLPARGERFPVNDPNLEPRLQPRPADPALFFQGLLEGLTAVEYRGYVRLAELGAGWPQAVYSVGGGAHNPAWTALRQGRLGIPMKAAAHHQAAYGTACLARRGYHALSAKTP
ncbi:MAG: FGGY-family carbohydrate kinase [Gammaproteobacteria bacterium]|nr:FGGY-family carbohydrate kinase [Gammaproteobacteria bacterium]